MESYLIKSSVCLVILYVLYKLVLKHESNHQIKRFVSLLCIVFACGFLFIPLGGLMISETYPELTNGVFIISFEELKEGFSGVITEDLTSIYLTIYLAGLAVFGLRSLVGLGTLIRWYVISEKTKKWGFTVVQVNKEIAPFTFFNILYIGQEIMDEETMKALIVHEQYHRDQWHSIDTVLLEILTIVYWFNPAVWLFQKEMKTEHEYMADAQVLKKGYDALDYQYLLFQARTGASLQFGSQFSNKTSLKKRFKMMNTKKKNTKKSYVRAFMFLPIMVLILVFTAFTEADNNFSNELLLKETNKIALDTIPSKKEHEDAKFELKINNTIKSDSEVKALITVKKGANSRIQPLFILKEGGKEKTISLSKMNKLETDNIATIQVLKDKAAIKKYGKKGENGVVIIEMKIK